MRFRRGECRLPLPLSVLFGLSLSLATSGLAGAQPERLPSIDPLSEPPPALHAPLELKSSPLTVAEKLVPRLRDRARLADRHDRLRVIVLLWEPSVEHLSGFVQTDSEEVRLAAIGTIEHQFVKAARETSFVAERGLSHFPIVLGSIEAGKLEELAALEEVRAVEDVVQLKLARAQGAPLVKSPQLRQLGGTGAGVGVAVVDSGIDALHPEFQGRVVAQGDYTGTTGSGEVDDNGHGTKAAGIIAGSSGMAPLASLWAIKVAKADGALDSGATTSALNDLYASRDQFGGLNVVNLSISVPGQVWDQFCDADFPSEALLASQFAQAGIALFVSSGNDGALNGVGFPACLVNTIAVGAVYDANVGPRGPFPSAGDCVDATTSADQITCYSNSGIPLDILAPSDCARTPAPGGEYDPCFNGTSAAAPYATGVSAQILSLLPGTTPSQILAALQSTGRPRTDVNGITRNRIDALAAFQLLQGDGNEGDGPPPPAGPWLSSSALPGFEAKVLIKDSTAGNRETDCIPETLCVSGALAGRPEIFVKVIGPRPNGFLWSQLSRFTPSKVEVWLRQTSTGQVNYYELEAVGGASDNVSGLQDREAFSP